MVRLISRQRGGLAALKLTKLFGIDDFPAAKDSEKVLIIIIYCYLIIIIIIITIILPVKPENIGIGTSLNIYWLLRTRKHKGNRYFRARNMLPRDNADITHCEKTVFCY